MKVKFVAFAGFSLAAVSLVNAGSNPAYTGNILFELINPPTLPSMGFNTLGSASSGQVVGDGVGASTGGNDHAVLWTASGGVDLNPAGFTTSYASATSGNEQVGFGSSNASGENMHALVWSAGGIATDLHPSGFTNSHALGVGGDQQVGYGGGLSFSGHALLWSGTSASAVDLNPQGFAFSLAYATNGSDQVGYALTNAGKAHAIIWAGTAASAIDLNPPGFASSEALGIGGSQQVGYGGVIGGLHTDALVWSGTPNSAIDLDPTGLAGFTLSQANATNGTVQVGYGGGPGTQNVEEALLWFGTASSAVNLNSLLPGTWSESEAYSVDADGNAFGVASGSYDGVSGEFAVEWSPVPEPATLSLLTFAPLALCAGGEIRNRVRIWLVVLLH